MKLHGIQCPKYLAHPIKESLLCEVQDLLEKFHTKINELYDLSEHDTCKQLTALKEEILKCIKNNFESQEGIKDDLSKLIPMIRRSQKEEGDLEKVIGNGNQAYNRAEIDVKFARKKISQLSHYLEKIKDESNVMMVTDAEEEKNIVASNLLVCFAFNSAITVQTNEPDHSTQRGLLQKKFDRFLSFAQANAESEIRFIATEIYRPILNRMNSGLQ